MITRARANNADRRDWQYIAGGAAAIVAVTTSMFVVPGLAGTLGGALGLIMIAIAVIDAGSFIIPDPLVLAALALGCLDAWMIQSGTSAPLDLLVGVVRGLGVTAAFWTLRAAYVHLRGWQGIGLGDVKLAAVAGIWLDFFAIVLAIEIAALAALTIVLTRALRGRRVTGRTAMPFGLFFAPAIWVCWLLERSILQASF
jgi:leader peptidase (prepilin peptidase) / N-methyltransferase